jgi:transcriptional regulator with XRE-family HTH domain
MTIDAEIGARVKARRKLRKLSHEDVARHLRCSASQVMRYEAGSSSLKPETLIKLAGLYSCKPGYFFEGIDV